ncbi:MAG: YqaJ viral recombinase family protein [Lysobacterales bacterium]
MKVIEGLIQGSPEWHAHRANHNNASEAAAVFDQHKYMSRAELLRLKSGGIEKEANDFQQAAFDRGHETEALARPLVEAIIGEDLYPVSATDNDGWLAASFDGITIGDDIVFEHKLLNADLVAQVKAKELEPHYYWQLEQQLLISGAEKAIFVTSDGTAENLHWMEYRPVAGRAEQLIAAWKQFDADLAAYVPEAPKVEVIGRAPDDLPALRIDVKAMVSAPDLESFKNQALAVFKGINRDLQSDEDFANAEKTVKWCKGIEDKLSATKENALSQTADLDLVLRTLDALSAEARTTRLELDKLVKARKEAVRIEILNAAKQSLFDHMEALNARLGGKIRLPAITADFAGVMKGLKTVASLKNACDTELARVKIESSQVADAMELNLKSLREHAAGFEHLFADAQQLVMKANDDLVAVIKNRISEHKAAEEARIEAELKRRQEQERLRAEEADKATQQQEPAQPEATAPVASAPVEPAQVAPVAAATKTVEKTKPASNRPSDAQLRKVIAEQFGVTEEKADAWLREYGFVSAA